ncbi:hypothetical protein OIU76_019206 [Salix suchowensis]|nr:hypothetical protein OIU76_019206 [Salix suchowensis]
MYEWDTEWKILYSLPHDLCDNYGQCGANTICKANRNPICKCLKGFAAPSEGELDIQNWSGSENCARKSPLCQGKEGFLKIAWVKLPDLKFRLNKSLTLKECETECLNNCSCSAYANLKVTGEGNVCLLWFGDLVDLREQYEGIRGEDIYIRVPASGFKEEMAEENPPGSFSSHCIWNFYLRRDIPYKLEEKKQNK